MAGLRDRYEMEDGSSPEVAPLDAALGLRHPLTAFALLETGDVFEHLHGAPPAEGPALAEAYVAEHIALNSHQAPDAEETEARIRAEIIEQLSYNPALVERLSSAPRIDIDLIPPGASMRAYGYPAGVSRRASGLFWHQQGWERARIAFRQDRLHEPALVVHEMAHAIYFLAFTREERDAIYRVMLPTYRSRAAVDEVFAIYSEREFIGEFTEHEQRAPGVYGVARQRWNEEHLFTRFVRNLYFPHLPLAGPPAALPDLSF